ncbi:MAG: ATP-dependent helicase HrpB [Acidobacteriota bacterium]|nr:ATP-dependent helicase HrpB [Acidobacteriota bacterium]
MKHPLSPLPIDPLLPQVLASLKDNPNLVITADPGAGKTTRVPRALLDGGLLTEGECWVLEPRRLAARLAALRVADELGESLGGRAGYAVRFEQKVSKATRIRFVTEGLLLRRLQADPQLKGIAVVVLDEFHERHLHTDLAITLLRRLQLKDRPDLHLLVMSATLDAGPVAKFLAAPALRSEGRAFPVGLSYSDRPDDRPVSTQVAEAVERLYAAGLKGHTLVFLPGAAEIRACLKSCAGIAQRMGLLIFPLHGELSAEAQVQAIAPSHIPKIILSTNVAESSVTLDGIGAVVDSGLGREAQHSPWSGLPTLRTTRISQARCIQRAGRAGRTGPGLCVRLFMESDFNARPAFDTPELQRADLAEPLLALHGLGIPSPQAVDWFEAPPQASVDAAEKLLRWLGALDASGTLTAVGRAMLKEPLHPRLARLVVAGDEAGIPRLARLAAALLETGDLEARQNLDQGQPVKGRPMLSDLLLRLDQYHEAGAAQFSAGACRAAGLDGAAVHRARQAANSLMRELSNGEEPADSEARLLKALLRAYPDRLAKRGGGTTVALVGGGGAKLDPHSRVKTDLLLALEADLVKRGAGSETTVRLASACEADWLLEAFPERLKDTEELLFNAAKDRVERLSRLWFEDLCIDESRSPARSDQAGVADVLAEALLRKGLGADQEKVGRLLDRAAFLRKQRGDLDLPDRETIRHGLVAKACEGAVSLKDLKAIDWAWSLKSMLGDEAARLLDTWAPEAVQLPKGRPAKIHYEGESPWIEARLQDFWGLKKCPAIAGGAVPLVLHLLAPNMRAVQVTTDLKGFWERVYQELRPGLSRRYPKHHWPE